MTTDPTGTSPLDDAAEGDVVEQRSDSSGNIVGSDDADALLADADADEADVQEQRREP